MRPEPTSNRRASAIWATTNVFLARCFSLPELPPRPPSFRALVKAPLRYLSTGNNPKKTPEKSESTSVKTSTCQSS